jgi:hypothetical protein
MDPNRTLKLRRFDMSLSVHFSIQKLARKVSFELSVGRIKKGGKQSNKMLNSAQASPRATAAYAPESCPPPLLCAFSGETAMLAGPRL